MNTLQMVTECYRKYFGSGGIGIFFAVALIVLWKKRRENERCERLFGAALLISCVVCFPLTAWMIAKAIGSGVYWRVFWMLPVIPVIAYTGAVWVSEQQGRLRRTLCTLLCIGLAALNGSFVFSDSFFTARENNYKLPTPVILVADAVNEHAAQNGIGKKRTVSPVEIADLIRVYDASIRQYYGRWTESRPKRQTELYRQVNADEPDMELLTKKARKHKIRYLILYKSQEDEAALEERNYERIFDGGGYVVYFDKKYAKNKGSQ